MSPSNSLAPAAATRLLRRSGVGLCWSAQNTAGSGYRLTRAAGDLYASRSTRPHRTMRTRLLIPFLAAAASLSASVSSTFDNDSEGWTVSSTGGSEGMSSTYVASGQYLQLSEVGAGPYAYFIAPDKFLGNQSSAFGNALRFDLQLDYLKTTSWADTNTGDVILKGNGLTLVYNTPNNPNATTWTSYSVPLSVSSTAVWRLNSTATTSTLATSAQLQSALSDLSALWIRGEFRSGPELSRIDNVTLIPEPATWAGLLAAPALIFALLRRRAHRS